MLSSAYTQQIEITICENNSSNFLAYGHLNNCLMLDVLH